MFLGSALGNDFTLFNLFSSEDAAYEVNHFKPKTSCWFIGETIRSDGTLLVVTPVDPLFLVLPYVFRASQV